MLVPLPSHSHYQMRHCESIQHKAEEGDHGGAGGDDPEGGQEREGLRGESFAGGGYEPCPDVAGDGADEFGGVTEERIRQE